MAQQYRLLLSFVAAIAWAFASGAAFAQPIPGRYIVVYKDSVADPAGESDAMVYAAGGRKHHTFTHALKGFAASLSDDAARRLRSHEDVAYVEQDQVVRTTGGIENSATWGLDRIDQVDRPLDTQYHYNYTGTGVYAFVIDTGIRADHVEFGGRVAAGHTLISDGQGTNDCVGHGTHVAGTLGGATWGVAKNVTLVPVRVLDCNGSGTESDVIAGIDWAVRSALLPAVANMSLGGGYSLALNSAVANAVSHGIVMVVAAGNSTADACNTSPASEPTAITVGATTSSDARASYSNYGSCVDLFAPGSGITSAWYTSSTATNTISGTSMATPHVTGVAALALQANPSSNPQTVANFILSNATPNRLTSVGAGSPNLLLYSLGGGAPVTAPPQTIAVQSLTGMVSRNRRTGWVARVTIAVRDVNSGAPVASAVVSGSFAPGGTGQCTTGTTGSCSITSGTFATTTASTVFTVTGVAKTNTTYDASQNAASQLTINR